MLGSPASGISPQLLLDRPQAADLSRLLPQKETLAVSSSASAAANPKLIKAAHEFEASLMQELIKPLLPGQDALDAEDGAGSESALSSFAGEALGRALSESGGLGIAASIIRQLSSGGNHSGNSPVPKQNRPLPPMRQSDDYSD